MDKISFDTSRFISSISIKKEISTETMEPSKIAEQLEHSIISKEDVTNVEEVIAGVNHFLSASNTHLKFEFHDELQEYYVAVVNDHTKEVIREIPPKKMLDMYAAMLGVLFDYKI